MKISLLFCMLSILESICFAEEESQNQKIIDDSFINTDQQMKEWNSADSILKDLKTSQDFQPYLDLESSNDSDIIVFDVKVDSEYFWHLDDIAPEIIVSHRTSKKARRKKQKLRNQLKSCTLRSDNTTRGTCIGTRTCTQAGGSVLGRCGKGALVCCLSEKSCSQSTTQNDTLFVNRGFPNPDEGVGACTLTINRFNDNICQMKFAFIVLELSQPDSSGHCVKDFLSVTGGTSSSPIICGSNSRQHMYIDVDPEGGAVRLTVDRSAASMSLRMWKVKVSQIECTSKYKAPCGCLQYFTETSGTVGSFNFNQEMEQSVIGQPITTRQIVNMKYAVCIKMANGYCSILWKRNITGGDFGFTVSSNIAGVAPLLIGDPASSSKSEACTTDYVIIPGSIDDLGRQNDRFCGAGFPNYVISDMSPFVLYVKTDNSEQEDVLNRGFNLDYRQMIC